MARYYRRAPRGSARVKRWGWTVISPKNFGPRAAIIEWRNDVREGARKAQKRQRRQYTRLRTAITFNFYLRPYGWRLGQEL